MGTLPKHHHGTTRRKYPVECGYCGVPWPRDRMVKDGTGMWVCPDDQRGRDRSTLDRINAAVRPFRGPAPADAPVHTYASPTNPIPSDWEPGSYVDWTTWDGAHVTHNGALTSWSGNG